MALVNVAEAAELLRVSTQTVKRRLKNESLNGERRATAQGYIWLVDIPEDDFGITSEVGDTTGDISGGVSKEVARLEEIVSLLGKELEQRDRQLEVKDNQIDARGREVQELHVLLQQTQAALPVPKENRRSWWRLW